MTNSPELNSPRTLDNGYPLSQCAATSESARTKGRGAKIPRKPRALESHQVESPLAQIQVSVKEKQIVNQIIRLQREFNQLERECKRDPELADIAWRKLQNIDQRISALESRLK